MIFAIGRAAGIFRIGPESPNETEDMVEVPNVVGMTEDDAKETLNDEGLGFKVVSREESKEYEKGRVSEQKTEAGEEVAKNTTIEVVVSSGLVGDSITVPDVSGMTEDEARVHWRMQDSGIFLLNLPIMTACRAVRSSVRLRRQMPKLQRIRRS